MTQITRFIAGDWGTSNLRLYLCEYNCQRRSEYNRDGHSEQNSNVKSRILETRAGPGINQTQQDFEETFFKLAKDWLDQWGSLPVLLSGMIGSTIGWKDAPYLTCPVDAAQIAAGRVEFEARGISFSILAGLRTQNPLGSPDVMRGEELQMLGWLRQQNQAIGKQLFALPGTHNKWTLVENGHITNFLTAFTGELFSLLQNHSILITEKSLAKVNEKEFLNGVQAIDRLGEAQLLHALFSTRSKQVLGELEPTDALSYLSGLIIGADVAGAYKLFGNINPVTIIGVPELTENYRLALEYFGVPSQSCDPSMIAISGYDAIFEHLIE